MSREERQRTRIRGAGRTLGDDAPVTFTRFERQVLAPAVDNTRKRKSVAAAKGVDFSALATPHKTPKRSKLTGRESTARGKRPRLENATPRSRDVALQVSPDTSPDGNILEGEDCQQVVASPARHSIQPPHDTPRRQVTSPARHHTPPDDTPPDDVLVEVHSPAHRPQRRTRPKLSKLERELGRGASRFNLDAPNYATPRKKSRPEKSVVKHGITIIRRDRPRSERISYKE